MQEENTKIVIYQKENGDTGIDVRFENESVWLSQAQIASIFDVTTQNIVLHLKNIYSEGELEEDSTCKEFLQVQKEGSRQIERKVKTYNLDIIISLGYRIKSNTATHFRKWATARLREYLITGFSMNDEFLKNNGGGLYWKKLLARIRDIRSSEKMIYRQVLDIYATSADYDPKSLHSIRFFKIVQNKLHYAVHKQTASEIIYNRADSKKEFMGLTVFTGDIPALEEVRIAKNYLSATELEKLNRLVSVYFELAELLAMDQKVMNMSDHIKSLDKILSDYGDGVLKDAGKITHKKAMEKAEKEYREYQVETLSQTEKSYLESIKIIEKKIIKTKNKLKI